VLIRTHVHLTQGSPVLNAEVLVDGKPTTRSSNADGRFTLRGVRIGATVTITAKYDRLEFNTLNVLIGMAEPTLHTIVPHK
jgi:hypothetical protein